MQKPIAVGFSNGANIAASLLFTNPEALTGAVLMRAMTPCEPEKPPNLRGIPVLMLSGAVDPIVPSQSRERLYQLLSAAGADVTHKIVPGGHGLLPQDLAAASRWLAERG